ncbi:hypothetical protein E4U14_008010 [Claviceps sp. LM454 group G7]|nr:hypothetical protein E4U14_008010 [Claviceps sp. LM454 group G7]
MSRLSFRCCRGHKQDFRRKTDSRRHTIETECKWKAAAVASDPPDLTPSNFVSARRCFITTDRAILLPSSDTASAVERTMKPWWAVAELSDAGNPARVLKLFIKRDHGVMTHHGDRGQLQSPLALWSCRKESIERSRAGVLQYIHSQALEMVIENLQKARERLEPLTVKMARLLRTPPSLPTPTTPRTAAATIASLTTITLRAWGCHATTRS